MEFRKGESVVRDVVDPEVRAYVTSLITALGGSGADEEGRYVLGDDALACLRDIKRWLKLYDEKANRLDVARVLAESDLVGGDILQILASWPEHDTGNRSKSKIALACLELLVPLTWPVEKDPQQMTINHHRHIPFIQSAQLGYKRSIINFDGARILHTAVRCALPAMAESLKDRTTRDDGIIRLVLYFLRNIAMIAPSPNVTYDGDETEISRSATIDTFDYQDIFHLVLTLSSTMGEEFDTQDVVVMEVIFHLIKGVDIEKLFMSEEENDNSVMDELNRLREKEAAMLRSYQVNRPTRHNRFGTMAWMRRGPNKVTTITGQTVFADNMATLARMDSTKIFKPPRRAAKGDTTPLNFDTPIQLTIPATKQLRRFVVDFLDSGFNPLFYHIRKAIDREADRILAYHPRQFFYLISWFLEAERVRRKNKQPTKDPELAEPESYALVASGLNQEMFITLNRSMDSTYENKSWQDLSAAMKCFTQVLLTVQGMFESSLEEDQEAAENILSRIFYEETTHDRVANITRTYKDQGFGYLDSCTELAHTYIRVLEQYSKQNVDLQVRSRRHIRRKKKKAAKEDGEDNNAPDVDESDPEDVLRAEQTSHERKFDFNRFAARFLTQGCVDTFVKFTHYYNDLKPGQLKRCHRYFYRVAFKQEMSVMLFRVDIMALLYGMIKGTGALDPQSAMFKEWNELVRQLIKRCLKKIQDRPELVVEMLFSKMNSIAHYLEYGYEKQTVNSRPKAAAEMTVTGSTDWGQQIGIVVTAMLDRFEGELIQWVKSQLDLAEQERRAWEDRNKVLPSVEQSLFGNDEALPRVDSEQPPAPAIVIRPPNDECKRAMFKNGFLRLLMTLVGFERRGVDDERDTSWIIPSKHTSGQLKQSHDLIKKFESSPPVFEEGRQAADLIKRISALARRNPATFDDSDDDSGTDETGELLFEPGGPTASKRSEPSDKVKKGGKRPRRTEGPADEQLNERAEAKRRREMEKHAKIKSELFVHDSDDESDAERDRHFFEREEQLRQKSKLEIAEQLLGIGKANKALPTSRPAKGKTKQTMEDLDGSDNSDHEARLTNRRKRGSTALSGVNDAEDAMRGSSSTPKNDLLADSDVEAEDTPLSSPHLRSPHTKRRKVSHDEGEHSDDIMSARKKTSTEKDTAVDEAAEDDEDILPAAKPPGRRGRSGFIVDSSDDEQ